MILKQLGLLVFMLLSLLACQKTTHVLPAPEESVFDPDKGEVSGTNETILSLVTPCGNMTTEACSLFDKINDQRVAFGLSRLSYSENCTRLAQDHSEDMAANEFFSHTSPTGGSFSLRASIYDIGSPAGENIANSSGKLEEVVAFWMSSSGHRANILNSTYRSSGVGLAVNGSSAYYTQCFTGR